jgi:predicted RNA-binding protein YlxR (DUF448 family)
MLSVFPSKRKEQESRGGYVHSNKNAIEVHTVPRRTKRNKSVKMVSAEIHIR